MSTDVARDKTVFKRECANCHRLEGVGYDLGLPLNSIKDQGKEGILLTGVSIMPEGLEKQLAKQEMADLIEYLMSLN